MEDMETNKQLSEDKRKIWLLIRLKNGVAGSVFSLLLDQPEPDKMVEVLTAVRNNK